MIFENYILNIILLIILFKIVYDYNNIVLVKQYEENIQENFNLNETIKKYESIDKILLNSISSKIVNIKDTLTPEIYQNIERLTKDHNISTKDKLIYNEIETPGLVSNSKKIKNYQYINLELNNDMDKFIENDIMEIKKENIGSFTVLNNEDYYLNINKI